MNHAHPLGPAAGNWMGDARLYRLDPPLVTPTTDGPVAHVIVSALELAETGAETFVFAATEAGLPRDLTELIGSTRGHLDHTKALAAAGYEVA